MHFNEARIAELVRAIITKAVASEPRQQSRCCSLPTASGRGTPPLSPSPLEASWSRILGPAVTNRTLTRSTLPLVVRRICYNEANNMGTAPSPLLAAGWTTALRLLQHPILRPTSNRREGADVTLPQSKSSRSQGSPASFGTKATHSSLCDDATLWRVLQEAAPSMEAKSAIDQAMRVLVRRQ
jgi:hypothetical protein